MKCKFKFLFLLVVLSMCFSFNNVYARRGCCSWHGGVAGGCRNGKLICNDGTTSPSCTCDGGSTSTYTPPVIYGCTDSNSINYNPSANRNDGSCIKKVYGCMDSNAINYNANANVDDGKCIAKVYGCTNSAAKNYNVSANTDDKSCLYEKTKTLYKKIKYKTKYKYKLFAKKGQVLQKGKNGKKKLVYKVIVNEEGQVVSSESIETKIVLKPISKIIVTKEKNKQGK